jgi:HEAT repeat protein
MLHGYAASAGRLEPGGFRHTGGWTPRGTAQELSVKLDRLTLEPPKASDKAAWSLLNESKALDDARAMLAPLRDDDWLVMAITH